jgi:two-component system, OmpR family, sensor histidine kinase BaeS
MLARQTLTAKLLLAFALVSLLGIGLAALLAHMVTVREFERFFMEKNRSEFVASTVAYYQGHGSWTGVEESLRPRAARTGPDPRLPPPAFTLVDERGIVVSYAAPYQVGDRVAAEVLASGWPVELDGRRIGTVLDAAPRPTLSDREEQYLVSTDRALGLAALGAVALSLLLGAVLARGLTQPLRDLTRAIRAMAGGNLRQQVPVRSSDELGELARAFNQMSADLAQSIDLRRQMTADIAHDLRTPLTVITGYIEALRDGVLLPTPERFGTIHAEAQHLRHLVEDLRTLSLADAGELPLQRERLVPAALLERLAAAFAQQAAEREVALTVKRDADPPPIEADGERLVQALGNLVANALRHTPAGGHVVLAARGRASDVEIEVRDDGEGIPAAALPHVFDRFYRFDGARSRPDGESGLGLAIARSIVQAHGGTLAVASDGPERGSTFTARLPAATP